MNLPMHFFPTFWKPGLQRHWSKLVLPGKDTWLTSGQGMQEDMSPGLLVLLYVPAGQAVEDK